jgi:hypothetical protein
MWWTVKEGKKATGGGVVVCDWGAIGDNGGGKMMRAAVRARWRGKGKRPGKMGR